MKYRQGTDGVIEGKDRHVLAGAEMLRVDEEPGRGRQIEGAAGSAAFRGEVIASTGSGAPGLSNDLGDLITIVDLLDGSRVTGGFLALGLANVGVGDWSEISTFVVSNHHSQC
jgi:hypothetical protein